MAVAAAVAVVGVAEVVVVKVWDYSKIRRFGKRKSDTSVHVKCSVPSVPFFQTTEKLSG